MDKKEAEKFCKCLKDGNCQKECRQYIDYPDEHNCTLVSVEVNGEMSLREIAERIGVTHVRIMQIEKKALEKLRKRMRD